MLSQCSLFVHVKDQQNHIHLSIQAHKVSMEVSPNQNLELSCPVPPHYWKFHQYDNQTLLQHSKQPIVQVTNGLSTMLKLSVDSTKYSPFLLNIKFCALVMVMAYFPEITKVRLVQCSFLNLVGPIA
jgi:hypothetical protein